MRNRLFAKLKHACAKSSKLCLANCSIDAKLECLDKGKRPNVGIEEELLG